MTILNNPALILALLLLSASVALSQGTRRQTHAAKVSKAYEHYRFTDTTPSFGLTKVEGLLDRAKSVRNSEDDTLTAIPQKDFDAMSVKERFTYCMIHGEVSSQNCEAMPTTLYCELRIFAYPAYSFAEESWSPRQETFLENHRSDVINLLRITIRRAHRVGANLKIAILDIGAWELIPDLTTIYERDWKDSDILSLYCSLMDKEHYAPFERTEIYRKLYGASDASFKGFIGATPENKHSIQKLANAFWVSKKHR